MLKKKTTATQFIVMNNVELVNKPLTLGITAQLQFIKIQSKDKLILCTCMMSVT